jgi:hypothetical protein
MQALHMRALRAQEKERVAMVKRGMGWLAAALFVLAVACPAWAGVVVTDVDGADANTVDSQSVATTTVTVNETYGEDSLVYIEVPYQAMAVVNESGGFFDTVVSFDEADRGVYSFVFNITNNTPHRWLGYAFEVWDSTFTTRIADSVGPGGIITAGVSDVPYNWISISGAGGVDNSILSLRSENGTDPKHELGATKAYTLTIDLNEVTGTSFGLRQVALVPEPANLGLLLFGLPLLRRRRRS